MKLSWSKYEDEHGEMVRKLDDVQTLNKHNCDTVANQQQTITNLTTEKEQLSQNLKELMDAKRLAE